MSKKNNNINVTQSLREKAESLLKKKHRKSGNYDPDETDMRKLLHELQVHQVELEMQNEELISTRNETEELLSKYTSLFDFAPIGYFVLDADGRIRDINFSGAKLLNMDRSEIIKHNFKDYLTNDLIWDFNNFLHEAFERNFKVSMEFKLSKNRAAPIFAFAECIAASATDNCLMAVLDITAHKKAETEVNELNHSLELRIEELRESNSNLQRINRTLNALRRSSEAISKSKSENEFYDEVCKIIIEDCGHAMVWIGYKEDDEDKSVRPVTYSGFEEGYLETLKITWADTERGQGPTGDAIRTGKPSFCRNILTDPKFKPWSEDAIKRGYASSLVLPLFNNNEVFGTLNIYFRESDPFTNDEIKLLSELADNLAYGIKAIRLQTENKQAEEIIIQQLEELSIANDELSRFNHASIGRELRMIELKKEVNQLSIQAGIAPPYKLEFEKDTMNSSLEKNDQG